MSTTPQIIFTAENKYRQLLEDFFLSVWDNNMLSSHNLEHHRRVWKYARELLNWYWIPDNDSIYTTADKLIIASYLHDLGMSVDAGIRHGVHSRELCIKFLEINKLEEECFIDVLEAVEQHDNKDYRSFVRKHDLKTLLTIADDLDAFGYIGIYRYLEIYLLRGVPLNELGRRAGENASIRFLHFSSVFKEKPTLVEKHRKRFEVTDTFFSRLARDIRSKTQNRKEQPESYRIVEFLTSVLSRNIRPENIHKLNLLPPDDLPLNSFFRSLENEEEEFKASEND